MCPKLTLRSNDWVLRSRYEVRRAALDDLFQQPPQSLLTSSPSNLENCIMAPKIPSKTLSSNFLSCLAGPRLSCRSQWPPSSFPASRVLRRKYAVASDDQAKSTDKPRGGHCYSATSWPSHPNPTPYDIFAMDKSTPYTKTRFYELVKLYHPDRHRHTQIYPHLHSHTLSHGHGHGHAQSSGTTPSLSAAACVERYRLVILANNILSNPAKRRAYDACGAGWTHPHHSDPVRDRAWRRHPDNAAHNATWEDWERWNAKRNGTEGKQQPLYMSNAYFVALVLATIVVGSALQASRARGSADSVLGHRQAIESEIGAIVARHKTERSGRGREERIERFLRDRDSWALDLTPEKYDGEPPPGSPSRKGRGAQHQNGN
ncbi:hypothetical protein ACRALDRAFT_2021629 [Sodiomyces alcalophilus JCM 7366]|uniref:uncharacterized protein n=1 Tax=Sodiomyces alcalophilus JCM 7366 TaxID=591952 RepID=UPI0039B4D480